ncbi:hypothetical protein ZIOFF_005313 [Zingiber officinale]|uniref:BHLH domain-containing protein n=1 Tax=Zingiber officinale TaxID=94328 RepID=A0A8J5IC92_ZINOF|nr:hypothetical protein ZIOFF_005313 [Zingiber officinale]
MIASPSSSSSSRGSKKAITKPGFKDQAESKWRTAAQQRIYGRRLIDALRATAPSGPHAVKEASDSALALTARGQSRWSRAILLGRRRRRPSCKFLLKARRGRRQPKPPPPALKQGMAASPEGKKVSDRLRVLGRLVPGCRKLSAPSLLEEAADYMVALEMQVKTMRALAEALSAASLNAAEPGKIFHRWWILFQKLHDCGWELDLYKTVAAASVQAPSFGQQQMSQSGRFFLFLVIVLDPSVQPLPLLAALGLLHATDLGEESSSTAVATALSSAGRFLALPEAQQRHQLLDFVTFLAVLAGLRFRVLVLWARQTREEIEGGIAAVRRRRLASLFSIGTGKVEKNGRR